LHILALHRNGYSVGVALINPGFKSPGRRKGQLPPGQSEVNSWPVLTYGPTPHIDTSEWRLVVDGEVRKQVELDWRQFSDMPRTTLKTDIHCVTRWSKLGMEWEGVSLDALIARAGGLTDEAMFLIASCYGGYSTNLPIADVINGRAMVATVAEGAPLTPQHGGPARLFVPHLYFWKSAKYIRRLTFANRDHPGFWEINGYHNYGDPWREQRYDGDG
jgi:DMSO/TMAO reductase YedYZ molybdopterin-dependent catalytic subunit